MIRNKIEGSPGLIQSNMFKRTSINKDLQSQSIDDAFDIVKTEQDGESPKERIKLQQEGAEANQSYNH